MKDYIIDSDFIDEWCWENNNSLDLHPSDITLGSGKKFGGNVNSVDING